MASLSRTLAAVIALVHVNYAMLNRLTANLPQMCESGSVVARVVSCISWAMIASSGVSH